MEKGRKNTAAVVRELLEGTAAELGYVLWDVEYVKEGAEMVLRITIDSEKGIDIDDCERMHRTIDPILDEADPIECSYRLEVSSPGVERTLSRPEHFDSCIGEKVEVRLFAPVNGAKTIVGTLLYHDGTSFTIETEAGSVTIERSAAAKVSTVFEW